MPLALSITRAYPAEGVAQCWRGLNIVHADEFDVYLRGPVWDRVNDAEFEADLIRMRTREGMAIARARGKLRGKQPKLSEKQQKELSRMHASGEYSISDLAELFSVSRPTVYRTLQRNSPKIKP